MIRLTRFARRPPPGVPLALVDLAAGGLTNFRGWDGGGRGAAGRIVLSTAGQTALLGALGPSPANAAAASQTTAAAASGSALILAGAEPRPGDQSDWRLEPVFANIVPHVVFSIEAHAHHLGKRA